MTDRTLDVEFDAVVRAVAATRHRRVVANVAHIADQLRKFDPLKPPSEPGNSAPLPPEPIPADSAPSGSVPSPLNPQEPKQDGDGPPPPDGSMLHLR